MPFRTDCIATGKAIYRHLTISGHRRMPSRPDHRPAGGRGRAGAAPRILTLVDLAEWPRCPRRHGSALERIGRDGHEAAVVAPTLPFGSAAASAPRLPHVPP